MATTLFIHAPEVLLADMHATEPKAGVASALERFRMRGVHIVALCDGWDVPDITIAQQVNKHICNVIGINNLAGVLVRDASSPPNWQSPRPGMLLAAYRQFQCDLPTAWVIGTHADHARAAAQAGCAGAVIVAGGALPEEDLGIVVASAHDLADAPRVMIPRQGGCWHQ